MPCYHPIRAWQLPNVKTENGKGSIIFKEPYAEASPDRIPLTLPCGQCVGCRTARARIWAIRCVHEASLYEDNCFITLTFNDFFVPDSCSLVKTDFQLFMKRLRKRFPNSKIRYFHCGEYGSKGDRPHHHACLFNFDFPDKVLWRDKDGFRLYRSEILERLWSVEVPYDCVSCFDKDEIFEERGKYYAKQGFCTIGDVTFESAAYVARYVMKKLDSVADYCDRVPEYVTMSRRPGLGKDWVDKFASDIYSDDVVVLPGGMKSKPPRFYDNKFAEKFPQVMEDLRRNRVERASESPHNTSRRLRVREKIAKAKVGFLNRELES